MYVVFCGMSLAGKQQYQDLSVEYMMQEKQASLNNMLIISDPKSTDLGRAIVPLDRQKQHFNDTVSGMLYIAASCNVYDNLISKALILNQHVFCKGCFAEVLGYQGNILGNQGISWEMLKTTYSKMLETTHSSEKIKYPEIIFFCISSFEQTQARAMCYNSTSWEAGLNREEYEKYSSKIKESYKVIIKDIEFIKNTRVLLIDETNTTIYKVWNSQVKPEIDNLISK
ncbi:hypothetical protein ACA348_02645 [Orientia tsutsugamushi]|uniref:hypothetical protein n=1 Tax=Orientia tsutsugamushi TaxID=784 RepID=UPI003527D33A